MAHKYVMIKIFDNFFSEEECNSAVDFVKQHESAWYICPWTNMYILGNSLFRKITFTHDGIDYGNYFDIGSTDSPTAQLLKNKLSSMFDQVEFVKDFSKPGFQVIKLNENKNPSVWHYDDMLTCFPFEKIFEDYTGNFNEYFDQKLIFTTLLSDGNYSIDFYPETLSPFGKNYKESKTISPVCEQHRNLVGDKCSNPVCKLSEFKSAYYKKGTMLLQDERVLHRVGLKDLSGSCDLRITLQGYGLVKNKILYLLW
jgi:hypothetical protein